jgi:hypothetical protein
MSKGFVVIPATRRNGRVRPKRGNVAAGFVDEDGVFHPIRASFDYDRSRGGDKPRPRPKKRKR